MDIYIFRQIWVLSGVLINVVGLAFMMAYPTSIIPALKSPDSDIKADTGQASWIASCIGLAAVPGFIITSYVMDKFGRRICHALMIIPGIIGWLTICFSKNVPTLIIGRSLTGLTSGGTVLLGSIIISEYSSPKNRGMFLNLKNFATSIGIILLHILGNYLHWRTVAAISSAAPVLAFFITCTWPESPSWLIMKNKFDESDQSFYWLRGKTENSINELRSMQDAQVYNNNLTRTNSKLKQLAKALTKKDFFKPVLICSIGFVLLEASGRHIFPAYALYIIQGFNTDNDSQVFYYTLGIDIINTVTSVLAAIIMKMYKRRTLLFSSGVSSVGLLLGICLYLFLVSKLIIANDRSWIPLSLFGLYFVISNLGCASIPLVLMGELFPLALRSIGTSLCGVLLSFLLMVTLKVTPTLMEIIDVYGTFSIYAGFMALSLLYLYFALPETKDKTLQEIENYFKYGSFRSPINVEFDGVKENMLSLQEHNENNRNV